MIIEYHRPLAGQTQQFSFQLVFMLSLLRSLHYRL